MRLKCNFHIRNFTHRIKIDAMYARTARCLLNRHSMFYLNFKFASVLVCFCLYYSFYYNQIFILKTWCSGYHVDRRREMSKFKKMAWFFLIFRAFASFAEIAWCWCKCVCCHWSIEPNRTPSVSKIIYFDTKNYLTLEIELPFALIKAQNICSFQLVKSRA